MNKLTLANRLYHGTNSSYLDSFLKGIDLSKSKENLDFGRGFYTTTSYEQAKEFAIRRTKQFNLRQKKIDNQVTQLEKPLVLVYTFDREHLKTFNGFLFGEPCIGWAEFIFNNRFGSKYTISNFHNLTGVFDYVYGCLADGNISALIRDYLNKKISFEEFYQAIRPYDQHSQDQLAFHSDQILSSITLAEYILLEEAFVL